MKILSPQDSLCDFICIDIELGSEDEGLSGLVNATIDSTIEQ